MSSDPSYDAYEKFCRMLGQDALDYEAWALLRFKLDKHEDRAAKRREEWLANETDIKKPVPKNWG